MNAHGLIRLLADRGIRLEVQGDRLRYYPAEAVGPGMIQLLRAHKTEIIATLGDTSSVSVSETSPEVEKKQGFGIGDKRGNGLRCDRCDSSEYIDVVIHEGQSLRRDCRHCRRFLGWPLWYGRPFDNRN